MITFTIEANSKAIGEASREALNNALTVAALKWHELAVLSAPVDTGRLRASLAWAAPGQARMHTATIDGETVAYQVPASDDLSIMVGTNVEYAAAVHDGLGARRETVAAHSRRIRQAFGKPITPRTILVNSFERNMPARAANPFIAEPGIEIASALPDMLIEELNAELGGAS